MAIDNLIKISLSSEQTKIHNKAHSLEPSLTNKINVKALDIKVKNESLSNTICLKKTINLRMIML